MRLKSTKQSSFTPPVGGYDEAEEERMGDLLMGIMFLAMGLIAASIGGMGLEKDGIGALGILVAAVCFALGGSFIYTAGVGGLANDGGFPVGEVREVICTAPIIEKDATKEVGALLRKPNGELEGRRLKMKPKTKHFVKSDDPNNPYPKFPANSAER